MADSLSYQEALSKGLVYPGGEQEALKITGGGKGFASTEAYKKAFDVTYKQQQAEIDNLQSTIQKRNAWVARLARTKQRPGASYFRITESIARKAEDLSNVMKSAIAKYKSTTEQAVSAEKRETGAAQAARKRLTRGTAGLLAKAGGAGGMVGTGLPMLGEGTAPALGQESQLGRKVKL